MKDGIQLQIFAAQAQVEALTDALLSYSAGLLFSTSLWRDYQLNPRALSLKEQVLGYESMQVYLITLERQALTALLAYLGEHLPYAALRYQVVPIVQIGVIGKQPSD
ncbi:MAG: DUF3240 family protein [Thiomicrospira sp.]|jgi:hypothetical protein|nr:DUF3240 family protein [Thiomicrospira sp.]